MSKSLIIKELRETWWLGLIAMILMGLMVWDAMGYEIDVYRLSIKQRTIYYSGQYNISVPFLRRDFGPALSEM